MKRRVGTHLKLVSGGKDRQIDSFDGLIDPGPPGPWAHDAIYAGALRTEVLAIRRGADIPLHQDHIGYLVDLFSELSHKTTALLRQYDESVRQLRGAHVAGRLIKRSDIRWKQTQPATKDYFMDPKNLDALKKLIGLFVDAFNDTENAFGSGGGIKSFSTYGNLLEDVMGLVSDLGDLPSELKSIAPSDAAALVSYVEAELSIPNPKAKAIVDAVLNALVSILNAVTGATAAVETAVIQQAK